MEPAELRRVAEYYDALSVTYDELYGQEQLVKYLRARAALGAVERLLDAGCGTGLSAAVFGGSHIVCIEASLGMAVRAAERGVDVVLGDAWRPPLRGCAFDAALAITVVGPGEAAALARLLSSYATRVLVESLGEWAVATGCTS